MPSSSTIDLDAAVASAMDLDASAAVVQSRPRTGRGRPEEFASFLRTQDTLDVVCKQHGVPEQYTARPAGALRANAAPPPGAICVLARALEAGMRVPLHGFFCEALAHFSIAPAQLSPNGWRTMAGFLVLCHSVGVPPSLAVFRHFFKLSNLIKREKKGWYFFQSRHKSGLRFTGMPHNNWISFKYWKHEFFFLTSPEPWPCPVEWGEPSISSFETPALTGEEKKSAAELLRAHGGAAVDLRKYLSNSNLAAAMITTKLPPPPPPSSTSIISSHEGLDPSVYTMMKKSMLAEKAAAPLKTVKAEPSSDAPGSPPSYRKKRSLQEANGKEEPLLSLLNTPLSGVRSPPPGFSPKPKNMSSRLDRDTTVWEPAREKAKAELVAARAELAKAKAGLASAEAEVVKAKAELTAAEQGKARPELVIEGAEVAKAMARLVATKRALAEELDSAKVAAMQQLLCCDEHVRRRAEHALQGYQRWRKKRSCCWLVISEQISA